MIAIGEACGGGLCVPGEHAIVNNGWWTILGVVAGVMLMLPITRMLLRRAERRARRAERRARDAERLAELGSMTGGLAHEIKNPLSTVGLNAQLLSEAISESDLPPDQRDRLLRRIEALSREVERLRGILTDFLQYAGRIKLDPQPHDLVKLVDELSDFFHPQCQQAGVMLRTQLPKSPEELIVQVDEGLLKQAILNLMLNAVQAMADAPPHAAGTPGTTGSSSPGNFGMDAGDGRTRAGSGSGGGGGGGVDSAGRGR